MQITPLWKAMLANTWQYQVRKKPCWENRMVREQSEWSWLLPSHCSRSIGFAQHCFSSKLLLLRVCFCVCCFTLVLLIVFKARNNQTVAKNNVSQHVALTPQTNKTKEQCCANRMVREQSGWSWLLPSDCSGASGLLNIVFSQRCFTKVLLLVVWHTGRKPLWKAMLANT